MTLEQYAVVLFTVLCVLEGMVFIEVRRLRMFMQRK